MDRSLPNSVGFNPRSVLALFGLVLVLAGVGLLLFFAYMVFQIVDSPQDVHIVQYIVSLTEIQGPILEGRFIVPMDDSSGMSRNADFEIEMSPELKTVFFLFVGAFALMICVNIVKIIVGAGSAMIKAAGPESGISIKSGSSAGNSDHLHYKRAVDEDRLRNRGR